MSIIYKTSPAKSNLGRAMSQSPHWLHWDAPNSPHNCSFPFNDHHPHLMHPSSIDPTHHPKWHLNPFSRVATVHFPEDRATNQYADRQMGYTTGQ